METNWKELAEKYKMEAEIYITAYEDILRPITIISAMQGILVQMESERLKFESKRGKNAKSDETKERIDTLMAGLDQLSGIAERNLSMKYQLRHKSMLLRKAKKQIEDLKKQLIWVNTQ